MNFFIKPMRTSICCFILAMLLSSTSRAQHKNPLIAEITQTAFETMNVKLTYSDTITNTLSLRHIPRNSIDGALISLTRTSKTYTANVILPQSVKRGKIKVRQVADENYLYNINYSVANKLDLNFTQKLVAGDGSVVFYPDRNTNMQKAVLATYKVETPEGSIPKNFHRIATVANVVAYPNSITSFTGSNSLAFYYDDILDSLDKMGMKVYKWTSTSSSWTLVDGCPEIDTANNTVATYITTPGVYAAFCMPYIENTGEYSKTANYVRQAQREIKTTDVFDSSAVNVTYKASKAITFTPGFKAVRGAKISTSIVANCTSYTNVISPSTAFRMGYNTEANAKDKNAPASNTSLRSAELLVYPNPSNSVFNIQFNTKRSTRQQTLNEGGKVTISIFDYTGRRIDKIQKTTSDDQGVCNFQYDAARLKKGVYVLTINFADGSKATKKLVKL